jgi:TetR/AcrR family transcriptional repressor of nem operon
MAPPLKHSEDEVLARALERFWVHGYASTTIRDLERALDLTAPAIYHRFGNKDELFSRVIDRYVQVVIVPRVEKYLGASEDPVVDLYRFFRTAQSPRGCLLTTTAIELGPTSSRMRQRVESGMDVMRAGLLAEARRLHDCASVGKPVELAQALLVDLQGLMVLSRLGIADEELRQRTQMVFSTRFGKRFKPRRRKP